MPESEQRHISPGEELSPTVIAHSVTMNEENIRERAQLGYYRNMWDTYKGHVRGMLSGIAIGGLTGTIIGSAVALAAGFFALPLAATITTAGIIATFAGFGAVFGADQFGAAGAAAASRASGLAEKHARLLDPAHGGDRLAELDDKLMSDGRGHHYEYPQGRDKGKFFVWKSGALGALLGGGLGWLLGSSPTILNFFGVSTTVLQSAAMYIHLPAVLGIVAPTMAAAFAAPLLAGIIGAVGLGIIGLTFGVERNVFKSIFNQTDANIHGRLAHGFGGPDVGREQTLGKESDYELSQHRLRRQAEITGLEKDYNEKILRGATGGLFRGLAGGMTTGALIGLGAGVLAFGVACLPALLAVSGAVFPGLQMLGALAVGFAGMGSLLGMEVFTQAGMEAGAETTARSIDNEFARNRELRARGITPPIQPTPKREWFSPAKAVTATALGTAIGTIIAPILPAVVVGAIPTLAIGAMTGGLIGMTYGVGNSVWRGITHATDWVYDRSYFGANIYPQPELQPVKDMLQEKAAMAALYGNVTPEDTALLNQRLDAARNFSQTITQQQAQAAPAPLGV